MEASTVIEISGLEPDGKPAKNSGMDSPLNMKGFYRIAALVAAMALSGCSTPVPLNYSPSNLSRGSGSVEVKKFNYRPAELGEVKRNEMQKKHPSLGSIEFQTDIGDLVADALRKELNLSGYNVSTNSPRLITGSVDRFYIDWVGFSTVDIEMAITFVVEFGKLNAYRGSFKSQQKAPKSGFYEEALKVGLADCLQQFIRTGKARGAL